VPSGQIRTDRTWPSAPKPSMKRTSSSARDSMGISRTPSNSDQSMELEGNAT